MSRIRTIRLAALRELLGRITHATPVGITALTTPDLRRKDNPWAKGAVKKWTRFNAMVGARHQEAVQRQQTREGHEPTFQAAPRQWGVHVTPALVEHKGSYYLSAQLNPLNRPRPIYLAPKVRGRHTILTAIPKSAVAPWLPPERDEREGQGVERAVEHRDIRLDSIVQLSINGESLRVRP